MNGHIEALHRSGSVAGLAGDLHFSGPVGLQNTALCDRSDLRIGAFPVYLFMQGIDWKDLCLK